MFSSLIKEPLRACKSTTRVHHHNFDGVPSYRDDHECAKLFRDVHIGPNIATFQCRNVLRWEDMDAPRPMIVYSPLATGAGVCAASVA